MTIEEAYHALVHVCGKGDSPHLDAARIIAHVTGFERAAIMAHASDTLEPALVAQLEVLAARRARGIPLAYVLGTAGFYGRSFAVDERVLVPRPETEELIGFAVERLRQRPEPALLDIGTGSGAIAVTLACELPGASVFATDLSPHAVSVARKNAAQNAVFQHCTFFVGDLAAGAIRFAPFDLVVANLPYVPAADIAPSPDPVSFEPRLALDGGADGLDVYRRLAETLPALLASDGFAIFEAGPMNCRGLVEVIGNRLPDRTVAIATDYAGKDRFVTVVP